MDAKTSLRKVEKISSVLHVFFLICFFGVAAYTVVLIVLEAIGLFAPEASPAGLEPTWVTLLSSVLFAIPSLAIVKIIADISGDVAKGKSPFIDTQAKRIRWISFFILLDVILGMIFSPGLLGTATTAGLELGVAVRSDLPAYAITFDIWEAFLALVLFCLSYAFEYGALLQKDADDTI